MSSSSSNLRALSIAFTSRGFGFVVMEGTDRLIDWGVSQSKAGQPTWIALRVEKLIDRYDPEIVLVDDAMKNPRRSANCREAQKLIKALARKKRIRYRAVTASQVRKTFATGRRISKDDMAEAIAERYSELGSRLPPKRKPWKSESPRMSIFMAAACAMTFYSLSNL